MSTLQIPVRFDKTNPDAPSRFVQSLAATDRATKADRRRLEAIRFMQDMAEYEAFMAVRAVNDVAWGRGEYARLSRESRQEILLDLDRLARIAREVSAVVDDADHAAWNGIVDAIAADIEEREEAQAQPGLTYTSDGYQPSPEERDDIESRVEVARDDEEGERFDGLE